MTMRHLKLNGIAVLLASLLAIVSVSVQAEPLKLRMSVESTPGAPTQQILGSFRDALQTALGDQVEIEYFDSGTLGDEIVHMQQVRTGQLDVIPIGSDAVQLDPKWAVFDIPFLFSDRASVAKVLDGDIGAQLDTSFQENAGLKVLGFGEIGFRNISNNVRPIVKPEDLDGL
jgi:TRAP-type C4-dicarboxylate transport system substrate-binding protein